MPSHFTSQKTSFNINSLMYTCDSTSPLSSQNNVYSLFKSSLSRSCNTTGVTPSIIDCKSIIPPRLSPRKIKKKQPKKVVLGKPYTGKQKMSSEALKELSRQASLHSSSTILSLNRNSLNYLNRRSPSPSHHHMASTDILSISRNLRTNLSKAKIKLMSTLKCSDTPEDIQMYKSLYSSSLSPLLKQTSPSTKSSSLSSLQSSFSSSLNNTCSPSLSSTISVSSKGSTSDETSSFHLRLVTDDNGSVSVVSDNNIERLSPMCATDYSSDDDTTVLTSSESCTYLFGKSLLESKEECAFNYIPPNPQQQLEAQDLVTVDNMNILLQSWKLENPSSLLSKNDELRDVTEDQIDSWLQRGGDGSGHHSMVMATDQELADLLDFDV
ncbi:hypothetical protein K501DRAFT_286709 [Backusella circina FSU 941]|nr:hypothetical protein K501DRAFT_286709 [Backusella circina FSU 941]